MMRRLLVAIVAAFLGLAVLGAGVLATTYMPLIEGSTSGPDTGFGASRWLRTEPDPFGSGGLYLYCATPPGDFAWMTSLRNDGPLPLTIEGLGDGPLAPTGPDAGVGFGIRDLAVYRAAAPADLPPEARDARDPRTAPTIGPTPLDQGDEIEVWVRFSTGTAPHSAGSAEWTRSIPIRYTIAGITRSAEVPLRDGVGITNPCG